MGQNEQLRKRLDGLNRRIISHRIKIGLELQRSRPNFGRIKHWRMEVTAWEGTVKNLERRLRKEKDDA